MELLARVVERPGTIDVVMVLPEETVESWFERVEAVVVPVGAWSLLSVVEALVADSPAPVTPRRRAGPEVPG